MRIESIAISNFKSFKYVKVQNLGQLNVLIGSNASGKTNFIQAFRFLRDIAKHGLINAVSLQGGPEYLRNTHLPLSEPCGIRVVYNPCLSLCRTIGHRPFHLRCIRADYAFSFQFPNGDDLRILSDRLELKFEMAEHTNGDGVQTVLGDGLLSSEGGHIHFELTLPPDSPVKAQDVMPAFLQEERLEEKSLLMEAPVFSLVHRFSNPFARIAIYDFDPRRPRHSAPITGKADLEEDGSNLAIAIKRILENRESKRKFGNLLKDIMPFIDDIGTEKIDKSIFFKIKDHYSGDAYLPSSFISDGTLNIIALIVALYFEKSGLMIIEEPERSIHPHLINKVVSMMKEVAEHRQIFLTTHHPDMVRLADIDNIWFSSRDPNGFSTICRPLDQEATRILLKNELGIEDLFAQNLLGLT